MSAASKTPGAEASVDAQERLQGSDWETLLRVWPYARPDSWAFVVGLLLTPVVAGMRLVQPWLLQQAIDQHIVPGVLDGLSQVALLYLAAVVGAYLMEAVYTLSLAWAGQRTILRLRRSLYAHTLELTQRFFDRQPAGKLLTRLTSDVESLGESLSAGTVSIVLDLLLIAGILTAMLLLDWRLTLVLLAATPPLLAVLEFMRRQLKKLFLVVREALAAANAFLAERVDGVEVVQLFEDEARTLARFDGLNTRFRDTTQRANIYDAAMFAVVDGISRVFVALMLWVGAGLAAPLLVDLGVDPTGFQGVTVGLMVAFMDYLARLFRPLRELSGKVTILQRAVASLSKIFWLFEAGETAEDAGQPLAALSGHVEIRDLWFRYSSDAEDVLRGVNLEIRPGESLAIVGASGSGKTTLTRLLSRSYAGYRGSIRLDGAELSGLRLRDLRARVATVSQDVQVFSESIRFNIGLDNPGVSEAAQTEATELVHADRFVKRLGWGHLLRERGADLSVGESQLLTFARTMAHDPGLVILDEATASVDSLTEGLIQDAIARILERKTVLVIAHRLSTVQSADRIAVMHQGAVAEVGSHAELMALNGHYAALVRAGQGVVTESAASAAPR